ncbi:hypothetical protein FRC12_005884 [Ceratobasidium sp. 428]|nr:hypothetical protein FRC12_005884 [Ceratobasidium sp. 428]
MPDRTYARLVKTTSMTISARRELQHRQKLLKKGIVPPPEPEKRKGPLREGLRPKLYTYPSGSAPQVVDPNASKNKAPPQVPIPVPRRAGQDDIPRSDSPECEDLSMYLGKVVPIAEMSGSTSALAGPADNRGETQTQPRPASPADTEIADAEGYSSEADAEGEEDPGRGWDYPDYNNEGGEGADEEDDDDGDGEEGNGEPREPAGPTDNIGNLGQVAGHGNPAPGPSTETRSSARVQPPSALVTVVTPDHPPTAPTAIASAWFSAPTLLSHPFGPPPVSTEPTFLDIPADMQDLLMNATIPSADDFIPDTAFDGWSEEGVPNFALTNPADILNPFPAPTLQYAPHAPSAPPPAQPPLQPEPGLAPAPTNPLRNDAPGLNPLTRVSPPSAISSASTPAPTVRLSPESATSTRPTVVPPGGMRARIPPRIVGPNSAQRPMSPAPSTPLSRTARQSRALPTGSTTHAGRPLAAPRSTAIVGPVTPVRTTVSALQAGAQATSMSNRRAQSASFQRSTTPSVRSTPSHSRHPSVAHMRLPPAQRETINRASPGPRIPRSGYGLAPNPPAVSAPVRARSASPRPPSTPLARSLPALSQLRATQSLTPASRLGSPARLLSSPRTPAGHLLAPVTPRDSTSVPGYNDQARTEMPGYDEFATDPEEVVHPNEAQTDNANIISQSPQVLRIRTPPPLAQTRAFIPLTATQEAIAESDGFLVPGPVPEWSWTELQPTVTRAAPTTAEFKISRDREVFLLQQGNKTKCKANPAAGRIKGAMKVGTYEGDPLKLLAVMRANIQWQFTSVSPWMIPEDTLFNKAKEFAAKYAANLPVNEIANQEFQKSIRMSYSQLRGAPLDSIKRLVKESLGVTEGEVVSINKLQDKGRCFYPSHNMASHYIARVGKSN